MHRHVYYSLLNDEIYYEIEMAKTNKRSSNIVDSTKRRERQNGSLKQ